MPIATGRQSLRVTGSLTRSMLDGARAVRPDRQRLGKSVRIGLSVTAPLVIGLLTDHVAYGLIATFGAFAGFHGHVEPYPQRGRLLSVMVIAYVVAVMAGRLAATSDIALILVTGVFAGVAAFVCQAFQLPAPREYMLTLICLIVGAVPHPLASAPTMAGLAFAGGAWAWVVLMSGWLTDRERPERMTVRSGLAATLALLEDDAHDDARRHAAVLAARSARRSVEFAGGPTAPVLRAVQLEAEDILDHALGLGSLPTRDEAESMAAVTRDGDLHDPRIALRVRLRELHDQTDEALPERGFRRGNADQRPPLRSGLWSLRNALGGSSLVPPAAARFGLTVAGGLAIGLLSGAPRPYWIALTAAAVLQGGTLLTSARRAIERAAGTAIGVLIGAAVVAIDPSSWFIVGGIGVFLFLTEMTIVASYVVAVVFITPMTLLLSEVAQPGLLSDSLVAWRLGDTIIGCALGLAASRWLFPRAARQRLDRALLRTLERIAVVLHRDSGATADAARAARHELRVQLLNLRAITDAGLGDRLTSSPTEDQLWPIAAGVQQLGYQALAAGGGPDRALDDELARLRTHMRERCAQLGMEPVGSGGAVA